MVKVVDLFPESYSVKFDEVDVGMTLATEWVSGEVLIYKVSKIKPSILFGGREVRFLLNEQDIAQTSEDDFRTHYCVSK